MVIINNQTFQDEVVELDNRRFVGCTFVNCILEYHGGPVCFDSTMMRGCRHVFFGYARSTVHYLQNVGLVGHNSAEWGEFHETVN